MSAVLEVGDPSVKYLRALEPPLVTHFELMATAPGGVARLRELILTLAVQGKLVPQDPGDESARFLLEKVRSERSKLVADSKLREDKSLANFDEDELPCSLPANWSWVRLTQLGEFRGGKTPSTQSPAFWGGEIPWITPKDMKQLHLSDSEDHVTQKAVGDGLTLIPKNSILMVVRSGILRRAVPIAINEVDTTINQDLKALVLVRPEIAAYVQLIVRGFERFILTNLTKVGTTVESIQFDAFAAQPFPLPPLAEQSRIVTRVEELMRLCDALEAQGQLETAQHAQLVQTLLGELTASATPEELADNWQRVATHFDLLLDRPEAIDALEQTILQLAVRGLLVPQDFSRLRSARTEHESCAVHDVKFHEGELPFEAPLGWRWVRLESVAELINGDRGSNYPNKAEYVADGMPFINTGHIEPDGTLSKATMNFLTRAKFDSLRSGKTKPGDLVYCLRGATLGKTAIVEYPEGAIASSLVIVRPNEAIDRKYAYLYLTSPLGQSLVRRFDNGSAQPNLAAGSVRKYVVPLPPVEEQHRIVARVESLRRLCADLRQRLAAHQNTQAHLAEALIETSST